MIASIHGSRCLLTFRSVHLHAALNTVLKAVSYFGPYSISLILCRRHVGHHKPNWDNFRFLWIRFPWLSAKFSMSPGTVVSPSSEQWKCRPREPVVLVRLKTCFIHHALRGTIIISRLMHLYLLKWLQSNPAIMARCTIYDNVSFKEYHSWTASI